MIKLVLNVSMSFKNITTTSIVLTLFFLVSCAQNQLKTNTSIPVLPINREAFITHSNEVIPLPEIFLLARSQKEDFLNWYNNDSNENYTDIDRIYEYLKERLKYFNFHSDTFIAKTSLEKNEGNCLSLAILTKSLADIVNVDVEFELVYSPAFYQKEDNVIINSKHIRSVLAEHKAIDNTKPSLFTSHRKIRVDYFPIKGTRILKKVSDAEFYSMFYNNKAVEYIINKDLDLAYQYTNESLKHNPNNPEAISMMAILHSRLGLLDDAEKIYKFGLKYNQDQELLLKNYYSLLKRQNRTDEAKAINKKLEQYQNPNPFILLEIADIAYLNKDYKKALKYYKKAARIANYLHEPFVGIARTKYQQGQYSAASDSMLFALSKTYDEETNKKYQAKFNYFKSLSQK